MSGSPAVVMRLLASAYSVAEKAGSIVRKVLHSGELGIVEKVGQIHLWHLNSFICATSLWMRSAAHYYCLLWRFKGIDLF